jgi:hypothetical protein
VKGMRIEDVLTAPHTITPAPTSPSPRMHRTAGRSSHRNWARSCPSAKSVACTIDTSGAPRRDRARPA